MTLKVRIALAKLSEQLGKAARIARNLPRSAGVLAKRGGNVDLDAQKCAPEMFTSFGFTSFKKQVSKLHRFQCFTNISQNLETLKPLKP